METKMKAAALLKQAIAARASDIFFLPTKNGYEVKMRTIAACQLLCRLPAAEASELINYFKFAGQMKVSEHRRPQVGSFTWQEQDQFYCLRFSAVGNFNDEESMVIRIIYDLASSNYFFTEQLQQLQALTWQRGLIITSGPTGSGKTTTMYELAKAICQDKVVMTIEDPVEIYEPAFLQTQVNLAAGISYENLLKAALRQRPDILIIGEIRDAATARLAVAAALSGHLVLATVHAKSTLQTIDRLLGLGISLVELENALTAVSYQRLLPKENGQLACLIDLAGPDVLAAAFKQRHDNFIAWPDHLALLRKRGEINEETYQQFQAG